MSIGRGYRLTPQGRRVLSGVQGVSFTGTGTTQALCPDLLSIRDIGEADGWRGRVVRGFFIILRKVTGV